MTATFTLALTILDADSAEDVLIRGNAEQTVGELAQRLAAYVGRPTSSASSDAPLRYGLRVERSGEQLRPDSPLSSVDLLEGDSVVLLVPRSAERRRPRWAEHASDDANSPSIIPLRPRQP